MIWFLGIAAVLGYAWYQNTHKPISVVVSAAPVENAQPVPVASVTVPASVPFPVAVQVLTPNQEQVCPIAPIIVDSAPVAPVVVQTPKQTTPTTLAGNVAVGDVTKNVGTAVGDEQIMGTYTGYGVPLSGGGFEPLEFDENGFILCSGGGITLGGGPLAG